jgi:hypothetical protein
MGVKTRTLAWLDPKNLKVAYTNWKIARLLSKTLGIKCNSWVIIGTDGKIVAWRTAGDTIKTLEMLDYIKRVLLTNTQRN